MSKATYIGSAIEQCDEHTAEELLPLVYSELRKLAASRLAREKPGQTLQPTALVHEAYLRLTDAGQADWDSRGHFFAAAAEAMRRILVDNARRKASAKRGGEWTRIEVDSRELPHVDGGADLCALDDALNKLATVDPGAAELVNLRYFAGLTMQQASEVLGMSERSAYYAWDYARSWLRRELRDD
jgi:RNA polymerase sigma factor (TIGR02999 family)